MIFFPMIVKNVSMEFRERLVVAIRLQSGKLSAYWIAIYLFHYTLYACVTFIFVGFQALIGNSLFVNCDVGQLIAVLAFWGHAQIGMEFSRNGSKPNKVANAGRVYCNDFSHVAGTNIVECTVE